MPAEPLAQRPGGPAVPAAAAHLADEPADPQVTPTDAGAPAGGRRLSNGSGAHGRSDIWVPPTWTSARAAPPVEPAVAATPVTTPAAASATASADAAAAVEARRRRPHRAVSRSRLTFPNPSSRAPRSSGFAMTVDETVQVREAAQPAPPAPSSASSPVEQDPQAPASTAADAEETHAAVGLAALAGSVEAAPRAGDGR